MNVLEADSDMRQYQTGYPQSVCAKPAMAKADFEYPGTDRHMFAKKTVSYRNRTADSVMSGIGG